MARWHDPDAPVCGCFDCTERRYHIAVAEREAEIEREEEELAARLKAKLQLRLPMSPLPHVAHQSARLTERGRPILLQPELI